MLEWKVDYRHTERQESDPSAQTYNFLKKLSVPDLELEEDGRHGAGRGRNPYDSTRALRVKQPGGASKKNPAHKEPGSN